MNLNKLNPERITQKYTHMMKIITDTSKNLSKTIESKGYLKTDRIKTVVTATAAATVFSLISNSVEAKQVELYYQLTGSQPDKSMPSKGKIKISMSSDVSESNLSKPITIRYNGKTMMVSSNPINIRPLNIKPQKKSPPKEFKPSRVSKTISKATSGSSSVNDDTNMGTTLPAGILKQPYNYIHNRPIKGPFRDREPIYIDPIHDNLPSSNYIKGQSEIKEAPKSEVTQGEDTDKSVVLLPVQEIPAVSKTPIMILSPNSYYIPDLRRRFNNDMNIHSFPHIFIKGGDFLPVPTGNIDTPRISEQKKNVSTENTEVRNHTINIEEIYTYLKNRYPEKKKIKWADILGPNFEHILKDNGISKYSNIGRTVKKQKIISVVV